MPAVREGLRYEKSSYGGDPFLQKADIPFVSLLLQVYADLLRIRFTGLCKVRLFQSDGTCDLADTAL